MCFRAAKIGSGFGSVKCVVVLALKPKRIGNYSYLFDAQRGNSVYCLPCTVGKNGARDSRHLPSTVSAELSVRSTGAKDIPAAKRIAAQIIESFWTDAGRGAEPLKLRSNNAIIGELIARYK